MINIKKKVYYLYNKILIIFQRIACRLNLPFVSAFILYLQLFRLKQIKNNSSASSKLICFYRAGGIHDLIEAYRSKKPKKDLLFAPRSNLTLIFRHFHKNSLKNETKFNFNKDYEVYIYEFLNCLKFFIKDITFLNFNFNYFEDIILRKACHQNKIKFKCIIKECFRSPAEFKTWNDKGLHSYIKYYSDIAIYTDDAKLHFSKRNKELNQKKIKVIGCSRAKYSANISKKFVKKKIKNILFYYYAKTKGIPTRNGRFTFFKDSPDIIKQINLNDKKVSRLLSKIF